jgi:hypothetical protein
VQGATPASQSRARKGGFWVDQQDGKKDVAERGREGEEGSGGKEN